MNGNYQHFSDIPSCIEDFAKGNFLIVLDAPSRENEGDLIIAARSLNPSKCAFMIRHTSGYLCAPLTSSRAKMLNLTPMVSSTNNEDPNRTAYTITVDATPEAAEDLVAREVLAAGKTVLNGVNVREKITTGISAHDRSVTSRILAHKDTKETDLRRPGHLVPLMAREGGVKTRQGHTEAGVEFARLAGIQPEVSVIGELVVDGDATLDSLDSPNSSKDDAPTPELHGAGMMRMKECLDFGHKWGIRCCTIEDLVKYVHQQEDGPTSKR